MVHRQKTFMTKNIHISAAFLPGAQNGEVDGLCRVFIYDLEWS